MNECVELFGERRVVSVHLCVCVCVCVCIGVYAHTDSYIHTPSLSTFDDIECGAK